jgi:hypothetical protein
MINSEKILIAIVLIYSLYALIRIKVYENKISFLKKENKKLREKVN